MYGAMSKLVYKISIFVFSNLVCFRSCYRVDLQAGRLREKPINRREFIADPYWISRA